MKAADFMAKHGVSMRASGGSSFTFTDEMCAVVDTVNAERLAGGRYSMAALYRAMCEEFDITIKYNQFRLCVLSLVRRTSW